MAGRYRAWAAAQGHRALASHLDLSLVGIKAIPISNNWIRSGGPRLSVGGGFDERRVLTVFGALSRH